MLGEATVTPAAAPFDDANADVILRTSDNVEFYVYKVILSYASPFFRTMFTLPSPTPADSDPKSKGESGKDNLVTQSQATQDTARLPVVDVQETSDVLRIIFECCYPMDRPTIPDIHLACQVLEACEKYEFESVERYIRPIFSDLASREPLKGYAMACRNGWKAEADLTAKALLDVPFPFRYVPELSMLSGEKYHRLIEYHHTCGMAAANAISHIEVVRKVISTSTDAGTAYCFFSCRDGSCPAARLDEQDPAFQASLTSGPLQDNVLQFVRVSRRWFQDFIVACQARLKEHPNLPFVPSAGNVLREEIHIAHRKASPCGTCRTNAFTHLTGFVDKHFAGLVNEATRKVELDLKI